MVQGIAARADGALVLSPPTWAGSERTWVPLLKPLAERLSVFVVKPDLHEDTLIPEPSGIDGIAIWHVHRRSGAIQWALINEALLHHGVRRPLVLTDHQDWRDFTARRFSALTQFLAPRNATGEDGLVACGVSTDDHVAQSLGVIHSALCVPPPPEERRARCLNVLLAHDVPSACEDRNLAFLNAHRTRSRHRVFYACTEAWFDFFLDFSAFDAVVVLRHASLGLVNLPCAGPFTTALHRYGGYKMLMLTYDDGTPPRTLAKLDTLGFHAALMVGVPEVRNLPSAWKSLQASCLDEASAMLDLHLAGVVQGKEEGELVREIVGYVDPLDGTAHLSTASFSCGCPMSDLLDGLPDPAVEGLSEGTAL